jgi:F-type H+-transporting ATPase subunit epsilon
VADKLELEVVTPDRRVIAAEVDEVVLPSVDGYMGVLPGHAPLLAMLDIGEISYRTGKDHHYLAVAGGYAEVLRHRVSILAETSELAEEIDPDRARRSEDRARKELQSDPEEHALRLAEVRLKKALSRIQVHGRVQR